MPSANAATAIVEASFAASTLPDAAGAWEICITKTGYSQLVTTTLRCSISDEELLSGRTAWLQPLARQIPASFAISVTQACCGSGTRWKWLATRVP